MKFWEAMKIVDEGGKVRRRGEISHVGLLKVKNKTSVYRFGLTPYPYIPDHEDLDAYDWELFGYTGIIPTYIDSESDEPIQTEAYQDIDPDSTYGSFPDEPLDLEDSDWIGDMGDN